MHTVGAATAALPPPRHLGAAAFAFQFPHWPALHMATSLLRFRARQALAQPSRRASLTCPRLGWAAGIPELALAAQPDLQGSLAASGGA